MRNLRRNLHVSYTLGSGGRKNSKTNIGIHGHAGDTRPGQTRKTPKNLSGHESEDRGREESVGLYAVSIRERGGRGRGGCGLRNTILLSYIFRYVSLADESARGWGLRL